MSLVVLHSGFTVFLLMVFLAITIWACQKRQRKNFEAAAQLALGNAYELESPKERQT
jgi:cbb3-type cytochrome oxidase subunit 3